MVFSCAAQGRKSRSGKWLLCALDSGEELSETTDKCILMAVVFLGPSLFRGQLLNPVFGIKEPVSADVPVASMLTSCLIYSGGFPAARGLFTGDDVVGNDSGFRNLYCVHHMVTGSKHKRHKDLTHI